MSVIFCVLLAWTSHCGVFPAQVTTKWEGRKSKRNLWREVGAKGCAYWFYGLSMFKKTEKTQNTQTHTHKLVCFGRVPCTGSVVFLGTGIGINENTACFFPFPNYVLTHMAAPWSRGEARATCFARPAQDRYRCNREGFPVEARVIRVTIGPRWGLEKSIVSFCGSIFGVAFLLFRNRVQSLHHDILLNRCDVCRAPTLNRLHSTARRGHSALCQFLYSALPSSLCYPLPHFSFAIPSFFCVVPPTLPLFIHFFVCWHLVVVVACFYF